MKNIRTLVYPQTDVFIVLFSLVNPTSLENAENMWIPEIKCHCPGTPYIIVGVQSSLRDNFHLHEAEYKSKGWSPVSYDQAEVIRQKTGAHAYVECDLSTQYHLKEAFEAASRYAIRYMDLKPIIEEVLLKYRKKQEKEAKKEKKKKKE